MMLLRRLRLRKNGVGNRLRHDCGGNAAIEFAIGAPILLLAMLTVVELGRIMWTQNALHYSVEEAARCYTIDTTICSSTSTTASWAAAHSGVPNLTATDFTVSTQACGTQVSASYLFPFLTKLVSYPLTLSAKSCFPT